MIEKLHVIMLAYNEREVIPQLIEEVSIQLRQVSKILAVTIVDDGSSDGTKDVVAGYDFVTVDRSEVNRGYYVTFKRAIEIAMRGHFDFSVIMDGDGQHGSEYLRPLVLHASRASYPITVGRRSGQMRVTEKLISRFLSFLNGRKMDCFSGLVAINREQSVSDPSVSALQNGVLYAALFYPNNLDWFDFPVKVNTRRSRFGTGIAGEIKIVRQLFRSVRKKV